MIIDEADADAKTCPMNIGRNLSLGCLGAGCMAWRWLGEPVERARTPAPPDAEPIPPFGEGWVKDGAPVMLRKREAFQFWERPTIRTRGFCGMAPVRPVDDDQEIPY